MAEFYVRHSLNSKKTIKFNVTLRYLVPAGEHGDHKWVLEIGTTYSGSSGDSIVPKKIYLTSLNNLDEVIEYNTIELCKQIDWGPFVDDKDAPYVYSSYPSDGASNVPITSSVEIIIKELLPSSGIDLSNMKVTLNNGMTNIDITSDIDVGGDPYEYSIKWAPSKVVYDTYF